MTDCVIALLSRSMHRTLIPWQEVLASIEATLNVSNYQNGKSGLQAPFQKKQYGVPRKYLSIPTPYGVYKLNFMKHRPRSPGPFSVPRRSERENACVFKRDDLPAALYKFKLQHSGLNTRVSPLFYSLTFPFFRSAGHFILSLLL